MADDSNDPTRILSGFLTESTRRVRRTLLAVSVGAIAITNLKPKLDKLVVFGNEVMISDQRLLVGLGEVVLMYFLITFGVYVTGDAVRAREATVRAVYPKGQLSPTLFLLVGLRVLLDLAVPFGMGLWAMIVWK